MKWWWHYTSVEGDLLEGSALAWKIVRSDRQRITSSEWRQEDRARTEHVDDLIRESDRRPTGTGVPRTGSAWSR